MPTYEYECKKCGHVFEEFQNINSDALEDCSKEGCDGKVRRVIYGGTGVIFKGSGFYINDYAKKESNRKEQDKKEETKAEES